MSLRLLLLCFLLLQACGDDGADLAQSAPEPAQWLASIERAHDASDRAEARAAEQALREALELPVPSEIAFEHRRVVHQDLLFRIAGSALDRAGAERALLAADRGLSLGRARDVFTANLWIVRGEALEALGRDSEAAASYYAALEIDRALLDQVLGTRDAGPP